MRTQPAIEDLLRELAPQVLGTLVRRHSQFDACEDAVQEALLAAANPAARLTQVEVRPIMHEAPPEG